jgi:ankyrin repeat protein
MNGIGQELIVAARRLLRAGADVNAKYSSGSWPFILVASPQGQVQVSSELLEHGADIEAKDWPPLHWANLTAVNE